MGGVCVCHARQGYFLPEYSGIESASVPEGEPRFEGLKPGDYLGDILYSDISAYINGIPVPTSVMDGRTLVAAEDLRNYGFRVEWDGMNRFLNVTPNPGVAFEPLPVYENEMEAGTVKCPYVFTDIRTSISCEEVDSFFIDGTTLIDFDMLSIYGAVVWNEADMLLRLSLNY